MLEQLLMRAARPPGLPIFVHQRGSSDGDKAFPPSTSLNQRSRPLTWTGTCRGEQVRASAGRRSRCCSVKASSWGWSSQRRRSGTGGRSVQRTAVERRLGCPETQTCRRRGARCRMKGWGWGWGDKKRRCI